MSVRAFLMSMAISTALLAAMLVSALIFLRG
jgi:hypothetical protein